MSEADKAFEEYDRLGEVAVRKMLLNQELGAVRAAMARDWLKLHEDRRTQDRIERLIKAASQSSRASWLSAIAAAASALLALLVGLGVLRG